MDDLSQLTLPRCSVVVFLRNTRVHSSWDRDNTDWSFDLVNLFSDTMMSSRVTNPQQLQATAFKHKADDAFPCQALCLISSAFQVLKVDANSHTCYEDLSFNSENGHDRNLLQLLHNVTQFIPKQTVK